MNGSPEKHLNGGLLNRQQSTSSVDLLENRTDRSRWRLLDERGRQTWHYLRSDEGIKAWPQSTADKYFLGLPTVCLSTRRSNFQGIPKVSDSFLLRNCLCYPELRRPWPQCRTPSPTSPSFSFHRATGLANMAVQCSCFQASSSLGMSRRRVFQSISQLRLDATSSPDSILRMAAGVSTSRVTAWSSGPP